jgi:hypothetical protein
MIYKIFSAIAVFEKIQNDTFLTDEYSENDGISSKTPAFTNTICL